MKIISRLKGRCFCAFCKAPRKVYVKKHVDVTNVVGGVLLSVLVGQAYWGSPDPRSLVIFCVTILLSEVFVYMRWRTSVVCTLCGFDPVVYKQSPERASQLVRAFYTERSGNTEFFLTRSPLVEHKRQEMAGQRKQAEIRAMDKRRVPEKAMVPPPPPKVPLASPKGP